MDFGFYDESAMYDPTELVWIDVANDYYYG